MEFQPAKVRKRILDAFDEDCQGVSLVGVFGRNRKELVTWAIEEFIGAEEPGLRALVVTTTSLRRKNLGHDVRQQRSHSGLRPLSLSTFTQKTRPPLKLSEVNSTTYWDLVRLGGLPPESIELLILDEPPPRAYGSRRIIMRAKPLFTLVLIAEMPPEDWAWSYLGAPWDYSS